MPRYVDFETTIKGGLPIIVKAILYPPEPEAILKGPNNG
jgi:hypothetical protein